ncbi:hypothetical protein CAEBREN_24839 [Caenorhabditis brenneri]|uniref:Uncharacterized protein n=1 Tax=Caenorhabditis brenneri TaxID=135651 RepID=G0N3N6_CAEBE|nr:hypothetical protein CAEBREN_24839 [Caenorhabditis brenneri]
MKIEMKMFRHAEKR